MCQLILSSHIYLRAPRASDCNVPNPYWSLSILFNTHQIKQAYIEAFLLWWWPARPVPLPLHRILWLPYKLLPSTSLAHVDLMTWCPRALLLILTSWQLERHHRGHVAPSRVRRCPIGWVARASRAIASWEWKAVGRMREGLRKMETWEEVAVQGRPWGAWWGRNTTRKRAIRTSQKYWYF